MTVFDVNNTFKVWWVNQGHTYAKAKSEGYLWAPMPITGGKGFPHWESITQVDAGDLVINYGHKSIIAFSIAKSNAVKHKNRKKDGWRVDVDFFDMEQNIDIDDIKPYFDEIRDTIETNAPFDQFRNLQQGYLFHFSQTGLATLARIFSDRFPDKIGDYLGLGASSTFARFAQDRGFVFDEDLVKRYILSLKTNPFVILSGRSGTGKSKLAQLYAQYLDERNQSGSKHSKENTLLKRHWYKFSYNDKTIVEAFQGGDKKINLVRKTILKDGIMSLLGLDSKKQIDMNQKKMMKELKVGDVIIAYQGGYTLGGIGVVSQSHFFDNAGDAYDSFFESTKNFIRIDWKFKGPMKINDFYMEDNEIPAFSMWGDTIHELSEDQVLTFVKYLASKDIHFEGNEIVEQAMSYDMVPVGHGWNDATNLLGCYDQSVEDYRRTRALDLILNAVKAYEKGLSFPFFLILDGMNTSKVDRYLSDILSAMESGEPIVLHDSDEVEHFTEIPKCISLPPNLCLVGTVYDRPEKSGLSPAVLDRANVIEMPAPIGAHFSLQHRGLISLNIEPEIQPLFSLNALSMDDLFEHMSGIHLYDESRGDFFEHIEGDIDRIQTILNQFGGELGFRAIRNMMVYMYHSWQADRRPDHWNRWVDAFDIQILQRVLPKIKGSEKRIRHHLLALFECCFSKVEDYPGMGAAMGEDIDLGKARFKRSAMKIKEMQTELENSGFVSFLP